MTKPDGEVGGAAGGARFVEFGEGDPGVARGTGDPHGVGAGGQLREQGGIGAGGGEGKGAQREGSRGQGGDVGAGAPAGVFINLRAVGAADTEFGIGEGARDAEDAEGGADAADEVVFLGRIRDDDAGDEDVFAGADRGAGGEVDEAGDGGEGRGFGAGGGGAPG
jgi:hypothetical protein